VQFRFLEIEVNMAEPRTVLYVEDNEDSCEIMTLILNDAGYETVTCATSEEGLKLAKQGGFSAIILDHRLNNISGVDICREIRTYDQKTPIIFYTADALPKVQKEALQAGAQAYLLKPYGFETIAQTIEQFAQ
jgi:two-component system, OmpR family, manganese sensing response regulator